MNGKKARELRKSLGMTIHNLREPEYNQIAHPKRIAYFTNSLGELVPVQTQRYTVINTSKHYYRKSKKMYKRG